MRPSASVSSSREGRGRRSARARLGSARPRAGAEGLEAGERVLERRAGGGALLGAALRRPRASSVRAWWNGSTLAVVLGERPLEGCRRRRRGRPAPRAAARDSARGSRAPRPGRAAAARGLPRREDRVGLVELPGGDQRLEQVAELDAHTRLAHAKRVAKLVRPSAGAGAPTAASPSESSTKPSTQPCPDWAIWIPAASARASGTLRSGRAPRRYGRRWAARMAVGNSSCGMTRPSCDRSSIEPAAVPRSASSQFPARHSRKPRYQSGKRLAPRVVARLE